MKPFSVCRPLLATCLSLALYGTPAHARQTGSEAPAAEPSALQLAIMQEVEDFLVEQASSLNGEAQAGVSPPNERLFENCHERTYFLPNKGALRAAMSVGVRCLDTGKTEYVRASLAVNGHYYVASQTLNMGQVIMEMHLEEKEGDLLRLPLASRNTPEQLLGQIATTRINAGRPIRLDMLRSPHSISKGQPVHLQVQHGALLVTQQGEALGTAELGGTIQVKTPSGKVVMGTVISANTVNVLF